MSTAVIVALVLAVVAVLVAGAALLVAIQARTGAQAAQAEARRAEALVQERSAALAALVDRRMATFAAQVAGGVAGGVEPQPGAGSAPEATHAYFEARLSQVTGDLEALVANLLRGHARSVRQDALAAAAQAVAEARPR